jgi:4-amino-4-deoxy-L-arabinose transferase-like glycosyltransferase
MRHGKLRMAVNVPVINKSSLWLGLALVLLVALVGRALLLASGSVSFHSDEAVVALMARHILQGERPVFFYGQAYMGSLDAWLVAVGFRLFGESVLSIRLVQAVLYLGIVATGYGLAWRISGRQKVAVVTGLLLAIPPVLVALYTTATLGGYNETLLLGNVVLWMAYDVTHEYRRSWWRWALLGVCAGLGWWANGLIVAFAMPAALLIGIDVVRGLSPHSKSLSQANSVRTERDFEEASSAPSHSSAGRDGLGARLIGIFVGAAAFFVGSAPWWVFNLENNFAGLGFLIGGSGGQFAGTDVFSLPIGQRLIGLFLLGLPTLFGLRFPWQPTFFAPLVGVIVLGLAVAAVYRLLRRDTLKPDGRTLVLGMIGLFCVLYFASRFSFDPTGRYFLPLAVPVAILLATLVDAIRVQLAQIAIVVLLLGYYAAGQMSAATTNPPGLTTQFNLDTHIPNDDDQALITFLTERELYHGYTNYWISFRMAFLSGERLQYSASLPYKPDLSYTPLDERYPPYRTASDEAERIAYVTANIDEVRVRLEAIFEAAGVRYQRAQVGVYWVYYDFEGELPRPPLDF